jgi:gluconate kinase
MKNLQKRASSRKDHFSKTLFVLSQCRIAEDDGFGDILSRSHMHVNEQDEVALVAQEAKD